MKEDKYRDEFSIDNIKYGYYYDNKSGKLFIKDYQKRKFYEADDGFIFNYEIYNNSNDKSVENVIKELCDSFGLYYFSANRQITITFPLNNSLKLVIFGNETYYSITLHNQIDIDSIQLDNYSVSSLENLKERLLILIINNICS